MYKDCDLMLIYVEYNVENSFYQNVCLILFWLILYFILKVQNSRTKL